MNTSHRLERVPSAALRTSMIALSIAMLPSCVDSTPRVIDFDASPIDEVRVDFESRNVVTYETRNCTAGANPVMHLFVPGADGQRIQVAVDDDSAGGVDARIALTPPSGAGIGFLLLRAQSDAAGTCDIYRNGLPWKFGVAAGGKTVQLVGATAADVVQTVTRPGGWDVQTIYQLDGLNITSKIISQSGLGAKFTLTGTAATFLVHGSGPTRVVVNDVSSDQDGDGLGDQLETALGTCSSPSNVVGNFNCALAKTPQDTDGDGLSDAWEVLGKEPFLELPRWGADPRHKDLFAEVDFRADDLPAAKLSSTQARRAQAYWGDTLRALSPEAQAAHAADLRNPDGLPGVSLHFDGCVPSAGDSLPGLDTLCGNWFGYSVTPPDTNYAVGWQTWLAPERRGIFHWVLGVREGGGQTSGFAVTASIFDGATIAHELGHTMGLSHSGADSSGNLNCKPQYASTMNYAYTGQAGFADAVFAPPPMNNQSLIEFGNLASAPDRSYYADLYENTFRYFVDRNSWSVDFNRDGEIAPSGATVKAYANSMPGGNCEGVRERRTVIMNGLQTTQSPAIARLGDKVLAFAATSAGIQVSVSNDTYFNCVSAGGGNGDKPCGTFSTPSTDILGAVTAIDALKVPRNPESVLLAYVDSASALRTGIARLVGGKVLLTADPAPLYQGVVGEPALALDTASGLAHLVFKDVNGVLKHARYDSTTSTWSSVGDAAGPAGAPFHVSDAPGIVFGRMPGDTADAMYLHASHDASGVPSASFLKLGTDGRWTPTAFVARATNTRPGLAYVPDPSNAKGGKMYAVYTDPNSRAIRVRSSGVSVSVGSQIKTPVFGFDAFFDNLWSSAYGVDVMYEPGRDTNLRAAVVYNFGDWNGKVVFQPLADGITDLTYGSSNDWAQIGLKACASIANPGNLVSNPMPCF